MTPDQFQFIQQQFQDTLLTERTIGIIIAVFAACPAFVIAYYEMAKRWERIEVEVYYRHGFDPSKSAEETRTWLLDTHIQIKNHSEFAVLIADVGYNRGLEEFFPEYEKSMESAFRYRDLNPCDTPFVGLDKSINLPIELNPHSSMVVVVPGTGMRATTKEFSKVKIFARTINGKPIYAGDSWWKRNPVLRAVKEMQEAQ
jgi:hypothetical protein